MILKTVDIHHFKGIEHVLIPDCGPINALVGKNNSGKSSVLQAIDMAGLALSVGGWDYFQPKLEIKDLFWDVGDFRVDLTYTSDKQISISTRNKSAPSFVPTPGEDEKFRSIFIQPDPGYGLVRRQHRTPRNVMDLLQARNYTEVNALDILYAIKFYAIRKERGLTPKRYEELIGEVQRYFPDLTEVTSDRTENDLATLTYVEYGRKLDILYSGTGLKHFLDVLIKTTLSDAKVVLLDEPELGLHPDLQRQFMLYLRKLTEDRGLQFFLATHSPVLLNHADTVNFYRITNVKGKREVCPVASDAIHTLLGDLGIRPSDIFNSDICILVEGATDVVVFEHVIRVLYRDEFQKVAVAVIQYGGGAADGIISGVIELKNIVPAQKYTLWTRDRDNPPGDAPSTQATQFKNKIESYGLKCHIWDKREIEFYFPEALLVAAQQGNGVMEEAVRKVLFGPQDKKFREAVPVGACVPSGKFLKELLTIHVTKRDDLDPEIRNLIEGTLFQWKKEIMGET